MTADRAKEIALAHAGRAEANVTFVMENLTQMMADRSMKSSFIV
ncbi:hypothetical protein [Methanosarcina sp.]|nr:hypothetical protein [Methanosarcina sp.]MDY9925880.1 hypothetical protein [Methanosarcina sp.]